MRPRSPPFPEGPGPSGLVAVGQGGEGGDPPVVVDTRMVRADPAVQRGMGLTAPAVVDVVVPGVTIWRDTVSLSRRRPG